MFLLCRLNFFDQANNDNIIIIQGETKTKNWIQSWTQTQIEAENCQLTAKDENDEDLLLAHTQTKFISAQIIELCVGLDLCG